MARPFVSFDGEDAQGVRAEVWVSTGTAKVSQVSAPRKWGQDWKAAHDGQDWDVNTSTDRPSNVLVKVTNEHIREGVSGWLATDDPLFEKVVESYTTGADVAYRVEWQRNKDVPRTVAVKELRGYNEATGKSDMSMSGQNGMNILAGLDGMHSKEALTNPGEDPDQSGRHSAIGQPATPAPTAAPTSTGGGVSVENALAALATARQSGLPDGVADAAAALALAAGATPQQVVDAGIIPQDRERNTDRRPRRAFAKEAPPYQTHNSDGRPDLGSYQVSAAFGATRFAQERLMENRAAAWEAVKESDPDNAPAAPGPVPFEQAIALADVLLDLADRVQVGAYGGGQADRNANSHTRARSLVFESIQRDHPIPFGADEQTRNGWAETVINESVTQFKAMVGLLFPGYGQPTQPVQEVSARPAQQAHQQAHRQAHPHRPVEGEDGWVAPTPEVAARFGALASAAGFTPEPNSPVSTYLNHKFGVSLARQVHGTDLETLVAWYEQQGDGGAAMFREHVLRESGAAEQPAA